VYAFSQWSGVSARVGSEKKIRESQSNPTLAPESSRHERESSQRSAAPGKYHVEIARVTRDACVQGLRPGEQLCVGAVTPFRGQCARNVCQG